MARSAFREAVREAAFMRVALLVCCVTPEKQRILNELVL
jgi:hypothetical protein